MFHTTYASSDLNEVENGRFYIHSDHLGSNSAMSYGNGHAQEGQLVPDSLTRYTPFGDYRTGEQGEITDRGYTGHHENRGIGLTYMNARYYLPGTGRFLSADTIVPDPVNPQQFNRYSYVNNNPLKFTDPSGHCAEYGDDACWSLYDRIVNVCPECRADAVIFMNTTLDTYSHDYMKSVFTKVNDGWRPPIYTGEKSSITSKDIAATGATGLSMTELGLDTTIYWTDDLGKLPGKIPNGIAKYGGPVLIAGSTIFDDYSKGTLSWENTSTHIVVEIAKDSVVDGASKGVGTFTTAVAGPVAGAAAYGACQLGCEPIVELQKFVPPELQGDFLAPYFHSISWGLR